MVTRSFFFFIRLNHFFWCLSFWCLFYFCFGLYSHKHLFLPFSFLTDCYISITTCPVVLMGLFWPRNSCLTNGAWWFQNHIQNPRKGKNSIPCDVFLILQSKNLSLTTACRRSAASWLVFHQLSRARKRMNVYIEDEKRGKILSAGGCRQSRAVQ